MQMNNFNKCPRTDETNCVWRWLWAANLAKSSWPHAIFCAAHRRSYRLPRKRYIWVCPSPFKNNELIHVADFRKNWLIFRFPFAVVNTLHVLFCHGAIIVQPRFITCLMFILLFSRQILTFNIYFVYLVRWIWIHIFGAKLVQHQ